MGKKLFWIAGIFLIFSFLFAQPVFRVRLYDTDYTHYLQLMWNENRAANQILNFVTGAADRTLTLSGNPTLADWFDQSVKVAAAPTFTTAKLTDLTDGYVPYHVSDASGLANSPIVTDGTNVGIGTTSLVGILNTAMQDPAGSAFMIFQSAKNGAGQPFTAITFKSSHGTLAAPSAILIGDIIGGFNAQGYMATGWNPYKSGGIFIIAEENWTDTTTGTGIGFHTTASGGIIGSEKVHITGNGDVIIGTAGVGNLWIGNDCSALSFTDRTAFFEGDALTEILKIKSKDGELDHASLPIFAQAQRKRNIEEMQVITKTRQKTTRITKLISSEEVKLIKGKHVKVVTTQEWEVDEPVFKEYDLYDKAGKKILDGDGNPVKHKVPVMEEYQVTEKVKIGEEDIVYRNLGNMVSLLTVGMQQVDARLSALEARI